MRKAIVQDTNVYVDGFNLYYGALQNTSYKWLNIAKLANLLLFHPVYKHEIKRLRYFTALISSSPDDPKKPIRQQTYLRALATIPNLTITYGTYKRREDYRFLDKKQLIHDVRDKKRFVNQMGKRFTLPIEELKHLPKLVPVQYYEEKGSDVNLASYLILDAHRNEYEVAVIVSDDSDLLEPIRIVKSEFQKKIIILNPSKRISQFFSVADKIIAIQPQQLQECQFPDTMVDQRGKQIYKPPKW